MMTMTANPDGELDPGANPDGEQTGDAALDFLIAKEAEREQAQAQPEQEAEQEEEAEVEAKAEDDDTPPDDPDIEFELDGKPITVKKSELPTIYRERMLEADYRRKTNETAELTRAVEQERQRVQQEREHYVNQWDTLGQATYQELVGLRADLPQLLETDPVAYLRVKEQISHKEAQLQQIAQQRQTLAQQQQADQEREYEAYLKAEQQKVQEKLPEWRDAKVRDAETRAIAETLLAVGYNHDELNTLADHRALLIARKAAMWDKQQAIRQQNKQQAPAPAKAVQPGARNQTTATVSRADELRRKAMRTHSTQDILAAMIAKES